MKRWLLALSLALCSLALLPSVADAKQQGRRQLGAALAWPQHA